MELIRKTRDRARRTGARFKTVHKHRQHLMSKLEVHDVAGLTRYARAEGIIESNVRVSITSADTGWTSKIP